jgi:hypothetical protein
MSTNTRIVGQSVRNMTVQIRDPDTFEVRGTGVLVSPSGLLVTCAHVVRDCGVDPPVAGGIVSVHIPATPEHQAEDREAQVSWHATEFEDDLVLLELAGGPVPPERVGKCGPADASDEHRFRSFGFRRRDEYLGLHAKGSIEGHVPSPRHFLVEPVQLESRDLDSGMSGAAVFDVERNLVVGFVFQVWEPGGSSKDRDLAFAVDAAVLAPSPAGELLISTVLKHDPMAGPELDQAISMAIFAPAGRTVRAGWAVETAPDNLGVFVGREDELHVIEQTWQAGQARILGLSGLNGHGKTSLVRTWLESHRQFTSPHRPQSVFWWTFDPSSNEVDDFLAAVIKHVSDGAVDPAVLPPGSAKANLAAALLQTNRRHILVLDGLDGLQIDRGDLSGSLTSPALKDFLGYVAAGQHQSLCILTGAREFRDFEHIATFKGLTVGRLSAAEGRALLRSNGVSGDDHVLEAIVEDWEGHALALTAAATYIRGEWSGRARRLADLPSGNPRLPFATRLQAIGNLIEQQRSPVERTALTVLALVRLPLPLAALAAIVRIAGTNVNADDLETHLVALVDSVIIRATASGDLLLHPVLRSLYRTRLRTDDTQLLQSLHRLLAEYYYDNAEATALLNRGGAHDVGQ